MSWCLLFVFLSGVAGETLRMLGVRDVIVNPPALEQGLVTAMQLAVDDVNQELASSNSDFDFVLDFVSLPNSTYAEDPSHPAEVLDGVLSSIQEDGAVIVVGSLSTGSALLLSYLLSTRMSFPLIAYGADYGRSSLKPEDDYMFRVKPIGQEQMQALIGLLLDMAATRHPLHRAGYAVERIGVLYEAGQDGEAGLLALIEAINEVGRGEIEIVRSMPLPPPSSTEEEFQRSLVDMSNSGARIMVVVEHGDTVLAPTLSAASGLNMTTAEYAWYVTDSGAYDGALGIDDNPTLARDLVGLMAVRPCPSAAASAAFTERWKSLLGPVDAFGEVDPMLMYAYDAVRAAASAIESVRAQGPLLPYQPAFALDEPWVDGKRVKESLEELRIEVSTGSLSFTLGDRDLASQSMCAYNLQRHPKLGAGFVRALEWAPSSGGQWFSSFPASSVALMGNSEIYPSDRPTTRGQHMKVGVINCDGFVNQNSDGSFRGASIDLIEQIAEELGFTYELLDYNNVVSFNAFVDAVQSGELNLGASCITITAPRMETASFSVPFWDLGVSFILKPGGASTSAVWRAFMPFTLWVWVGILMAVICSAILLFMLESSVNDDFYFPPTAFKSMMKSLYVTGCVLFQHLAHKPETMAGYVLTTGWMFFTFLIGAVYTANLASFLTAQRVANQPLTFEAVQAGLIQERFLAITKDSSIEASYLRDFKGCRGGECERGQYLTCLTFSECLELVANGTAYATMMDRPVAEYALSHNKEFCDLSAPAGFDFDPQGYGLVLPFASPLKAEIDLAIQRVRERGFILNQIQLARAESICNSQDAQETQSNENGAMTFADLQGAFAILAIAYLVSILLRVGQIAKRSLEDDKGARSAAISTRLNRSARKKVVLQAATTQLEFLKKLGSERFESTSTASHRSHNERGRRLSTHSQPMGGDVLHSQRDHHHFSAPPWVSTVKSEGSEA